MRNLYLPKLDVHDERKPVSCWWDGLETLWPENIPAMTALRPSPNDFFIRGSGLRVNKAYRTNPYAVDGEVKVLGAAGLVKALRWGKAERVNVFFI